MKKNYFRRLKDPRTPGRQLKRKDQARKNIAWEELSAEAQTALHHLLASPNFLRSSEYSAETAIELNHFGLAEESYNKSSDTYILVLTVKGEGMAGTQPRVAEIDDTDLPYRRQPYTDTQARLEDDLADLQARYTETLQRSEVPLYLKTCLNILAAQLNSEPGDPSDNDVLMDTATELQALASKLADLDARMDDIIGQLNSTR